LTTTISSIGEERKMTVKKFKQVCECKNCGNEAEMTITCSLKTKEEGAVNDAVLLAQEKKQVKGRGVCSHCGNEADMWVDL
jgi:hypothetical protein